ncbi:MAG: baseplate J/gp47 family protein [Eubacterium sp.]|nr:baseplate J/gp47 family protein [Eubacterium sp.]
MNKTYEEILESMKIAYFNECGVKLDENSETAKRFEAVASELFAISCYGDYIFRQAFIQTATGEYLDEHGAVRDCIRKTASKAEGTLTFYVDEPATEKIIISKDTVCSVENSPYLQYATVEEAAIEADETSVSVGAQALEAGFDYNVSAGEITVMVNAPVGVSGVRNDAAFSGGYDDESDSSFRDRIMKHYSISANGVSTQSIENVVLLLDFVTDCFIPVAENPGEIVAIVATKNNSLTQAQTEQIKSAIGISELTGASVDVQVAQLQNFSVTVEANIRSGFNKDEIKNQIADTVTELCSANRIGRAVVLNTISKSLLSFDGISSFNVYSNEAFGEVVPCDSKSYLHLDNLVVNCFDE